MKVSAIRSSTLPQIVIIGLCLLPAFFVVACNRTASKASQGGTESASQPGLKRYQMKGKVVSVDKQSGMVNLDSEAIPGFMDAMTMSYPVRPATVLDELAAGDVITADVVVQGERYWLENVIITQRSGSPPPKPIAVMHIPAPGDSVPDFQFTNQNGKRVALNQYRGMTLLITFIYTRCPFPDYCPRVSGEFAEINRDLLENPALAGKTHLLSISFDPAHDTPQILYSYGLAYGGKQPSLFRHWEFVVPRTADLPRIASYFGVTYQEGGGLITHSLSTAVIAPDGRIFKWYHGNDWQVGDLLKDTADSLSHSG